MTNSTTNIYTTETICAVATPAGIGAIGVIRISGLETFPIVNKIFRGKNLEKQASHPRW